MFYLTLLGFGSYISYQDFVRHIIPNRALIYLSLVVGVHLFARGLFFHHALFAIKVLPFLILFQWITAGVVGMGDMKFILVLALLAGSGELFLQGINFASLVAMCYALMYIVAFRTLRTSIPLAPALTIGFLLARLSL